MEFYSPYPPSNIFAALFKTSHFPLPSSTASNSIHCPCFLIQRNLSLQIGLPLNSLLPISKIACICTSSSSCLLKREKPRPFSKTISLEYNQYFFTCHLLRNLASLITNFLCSIFSSYPSSFLKQNKTQTLYVLPNFISTVFSSQNTWNNYLLNRIALSLELSFRLHS